MQSAPNSATWRTPVTALLVEAAAIASRRRGCCKGNAFVRHNAVIATLATRRCHPHHRRLFLRARTSTHRSYSRQETQQKAHHLEASRRRPTFCAHIISIPIVPEIERFKVAVQ